MTLSRAVCSVACSINPLAHTARVSLPPFPPPLSADRTEPCPHDAHASRVYPVRPCSEDLPCLTLGRGSNVLFDDRGYEGVVAVNCIDFLERRPVGTRDDVHPGEDAHPDDGDDDDDEKRATVPAGRSVEEDDACADEEMLLRVGAGYPFNQLGATLSREGWGGLEFAVGIPGTVGGAVFMNAGADGQDTASALESVEVLSPDGRSRRTVRAARLRFGYRASPFQSPRGGAIASPVEDDVSYDMADDLAGCVITAATFRMRRDATAASRARSSMRRRRATQPLAERSVGCLFRNPGVGPLSAGALIDEAGLKGVAMGSASVSDVHANFLVLNDGGVEGGGGARDMEDLIDAVKRRVLEATGHELHEEVWRVPYRPRDDAAEGGRGAAGNGVGGKTKGTHPR